MSTDECRAVDALTRQSEQSNKRCVSFENACPNCLCEEYSVGIGSPGPINSEERLTRFHFSPLDFDFSGKLTTFAFSDVESIGLSITREQASDEVMLAAIERRLHLLEPDVVWHSVSVASASAIRALTRTQENKAPERAFCVYDTAEPENVQHAEVMQTKAGRKLRSELRKQFGAVLRSEYRSGRLHPCQPQVTKP